VKYIRLTDRLPDQKQRNEILRTLCERYPEIQRGTLAKSLCGRSIEYLQIGEQKCNPVLFAGAFHGMEWITSLILFRFAEQLGRALQTGRRVSDVDIGAFLRRRGVVIVPCVNPDGVEISIHGSVSAGCYQELVYHAAKGNTDRWQANARGVDLNHNYNAGWEELHKLEQKSGICSANPTRYGGAYPESEPETQAMVKLCRARQFRHALAFHSQGEEIYWHYGDPMPEKAYLMAQVMATSSGYALSAPEGLAVGGGFKDWFLSEFHRPAFTIEVGLGENPLPIDDFISIYPKLEEMLILSAIM
jgi:g-D-glutamyl-meso-diaminopimelate peptidase